MKGKIKKSLFGLIIGLIIGQNSLQAMEIPIYLTQAQGSPGVVVGKLSELNQEEYTHYEAISINVETHKTLEELLLTAALPQTKSIQLNIQLTDEPLDQEYWEQLASRVVHLDKKIYFNIIPNRVKRLDDKEPNLQNQQEDTKTQEQQILELVQLLEKETKEVPFYQIQWVYTITHLEDIAYALKQDVDLLHIQLKDFEDIDLLEKLFDTYANDIEVVVTDAIGLNTQLTQEEQLKLVNQFYYELPLEYPNVKTIYLTTPYKHEEMGIVTTYTRVLEQSWMDTKSHMPQGEMVIPLEDVTAINEESMQIILLIEDQSIEYVQYKLNGETVGSTSIYPYAMALEQSQITMGNNELRVIIKYKDVEEPNVQRYYLASQKIPQVPMRQPRTTPTYALDQEMIYETKYIPVLMYHMFKDVVTEDHADQSISVSVQLFEEQIQMLQQEGYTAITFLDYYNYLEGIGGLPKQPYIIAADDGYMDNYTHAYPILQKYQIPATFFVTTQYVGVMTAHDHFTWEQAREMEASGLIDIQNHTVQHLLLNTLGKDEANYEVTHGMGEIERELGKRDVKVLAYPQFAYSEETMEWLMEWGIQLQMTNLIKEGEKSLPQDIKRIHVHNQLSPEALIEQIKNLTEQITEE